MNKRILGLLVACAMAGPIAAQAQTYDLNITMTGLAPTPTTFSGSFTFNAQGNCQGSAAFCPVGSIPELSNVHVSDPLSIDPPGGAMAFTGGLGSIYGVELVDTYYGTQGPSSNNFYLWFSTPQLLGSNARNLQVSDIAFWGGGPSSQKLRRIFSITDARSDMHPCESACRRIHSDRTAIGHTGHPSRFLTLAIVRCHHRFRT